MSCLQCLFVNTSANSFRERFVHVFVSVFVSVLANVVVNCSCPVREHLFVNVFENGL